MAALCKHLSANVRVTRRSRGMTQVALAKTAGIAASHVRLLEGAATNTTLHTVEKLALALGVSPIYLLMPPGSLDR